MSTTFNNIEIANDVIQYHNVVSYSDVKKYVLTINKHFPVNFQISIYTAIFFDLILFDVLFRKHKVECPD